MWRDVHDPVLRFALEVWIGEQDKIDDKAPIPGVKRNLRQCISKRFELGNLTPDCLDLQAAALDPRFRHLSFLNLRQTTNLQASLTARVHEKMSRQLCTMGSVTAEFEVRHR